MRVIGGDFADLLGALLPRKEKVQAFDTINSESQASGLKTAALTTRPFLRNRRQQKRYTCSTALFKLFYGATPR